MATSAMTADPAAAGGWLFIQRAQGCESTLSELADLLPWDKMPQVPSESSAVETVATYKAELQERAAGGDKAAQVMLELGEGYEPAE